MIVNFCDAKIRRDGREWIIGNFRRCIRDNRKECRFASVRKANETDIGKKFELKFSIKRFAWVAKLGNLWRLARRAAEVPVAIAAIAAVSDNLTVAIKSKVSDNFAVAFYDCTKLKSVTFAATCRASEYN